MIEGVVVAGFAGWRLASLLVREDGPWHVFERLRRAAGVPETGEVRGVLAEILTCVLCASLWTSAASMAAWILATGGAEVGEWVVSVFAAAGFALLVESFNVRLWR